ncbi:MAG: DNRLRE domain-containing protein, partial [Holophagales bacterium]|nr:DNRLRE domain-containing protein [Holophagales bacterium]
MELPRLDPAGTEMPAASRRSFAARLLAPALAAVSALLATPPAAAEEVVLLPSQDATLYEDGDGDLANGSGSYVFVGWGNAPKRALFRFDLAAVPPGSLIQEAELTLFMSRTIVSGMRNELYRVTTSWSEGPSDPGGQEGLGEASLPGDTTWIHTHFDTAFWASPGGDFVATPSADRLVSDQGFYTWGSTPEMVADVQLWLDDPASNHGWVMIGPESFFMSAKRFDSRENSNPDRRPRLRVVFRSPVADPTEVPVLGPRALTLLALLVGLAGAGLL